MYQEERLKEILSLIDRQKIISVEELKTRLYVSTSTVRRDLAELSRRGLIVRSSGGAVAMSDRERSDPLMKGLPGKAASSNAIGACAAQLVEDSQIVFLGAGAAAAGMLPFLQSKKDLTVVTNCADVVAALCGCHINVYCCSGLYSAHDSAFCGTSAAQFLRHFRIDTAFFTCDALTPDGMLSYSDLDQMELFREIQERAARRVLLCSRAKIGRQAPCNIMHASRVHDIVTDAPELLKGLPCEVLSAVSR